jgi:hypothetical protein
VCGSTRRRQCDALAEQDGQDDELEPVECSQLVVCADRERPADQVNIPVGPMDAWLLEEARWPAL